MDNTNWKYYKKIANGQLAESNLLYTPTVNPEGNIMCMHYCIDTDYRINTPAKLTNDLVEWFFDRETKFLIELQDLECTPKVYEIDTQNKKIFIEWNNETLSQVVNDPNRSIDTELPDYTDQLTRIFKQFHDAGYYKLSLYPHCFFVNKDKKLKTIDYYAVVPHDQQYIERKIINGIIGPDGAYRFDNSTSSGLLDFKKFHEITINKHLDNYWDNNTFKKIYKELYND